MYMVINTPLMTLCLCCDFCLYPFTPIFIFNHFATYGGIILITFLILRFDICELDSHELLDCSNFNIAMLCVWTFYVLFVSWMNDLLINMTCHLCKIFRVIWTNETVMENNQIPFFASWALIFRFRIFAFLILVLLFQTFFAHVMLVDPPDTLIETCICEIQASW